MKSAYELAMERFGGDEEPLKLTDEQKEELAEVDRQFDAKIAEAQIRTKQRIRSAEPDVRREIAPQLAVEIQGVNEARERKKDKLRETFAARNREETA